jgi:hypothetical protein
VAQQRVHIIHLPVAGTGIAARTVDFFHDDRSFSKAKTRSAVLFWNQGRHPACAGQRVDKCFGIAAFGIYLTMIFVGKFSADRADAVANVHVVGWGRSGHVLLRLLANITANVAGLLASFKDMIMIESI